MYARNQYISLFPESTNMDAFHTQQVDAFPQESSLFDAPDGKLIKLKNKPLRSGFHFLLALTLF